MRPEVLAEAYQTVMRLYGVTDAYERLKKQTRGQDISKSCLDEILDTCKDLPLSVKQRLKDLSSNEYKGLAQELVRDFTF